ncbi:hypothetical protein Daus18300_004556 [Diaporthe australafricana]|uniref:Myb-like domain-containing protein n=1 Tax=Diaporthe australafricana TaxID=127596 RepID=A0ABR3X7L9_9PEZI
MEMFKLMSMKLKSMSTASDASSAEDPTWELERQILLDEVKGLKNSFSDLEDALRQTQNESASQVQEAIDANKDQIEELRTKNSTLSRQIKEAEEREARLKDRIGVLLCGQPGPSAPASSSRPHPSEPFNDLDSSAEDDASEEDTAAQRPSQQKSDAARKARGKRQPQTRTPWSIRDVKTLINLIMKFGPYYSQLELLWKDFPNVHPRDQRQIKDKARNLKIDFLK